MTVGRDSMHTGPGVSAQDSAEAAARGAGSDETTPVAEARTGARSDAPAETPSETVAGTPAGTSDEASDEVSDETLAGASEETPDEVEEQQERRSRGRPRDPDLDARAFAATLDVFGERGWSGLTVDEIASRARIGKSAIYLRWKNKETLLADALRSVQLSPVAFVGARDDAEDGDLRDFLVELALRRGELYMGPAGLAMLRLYVEAQANPDLLAAVRHQAVTRFVLRERARVERAIVEGELPPEASPVQLLDVIEGAMLMHVLVTPPELSDRVRAGLRRYAEQLVERQLAAARHTDQA